jgi:serine/threonine protein kinase
MATRTLANTVNPDIIALNAAIFRYAGHNVLTPHASIQQTWWTDTRIKVKVTPDFINSKLRLEARRQLHSAIGFGDGLTDDTYMDWILSRAKRVFLTLVECGVPEQIFGIVDDSWGDDDLPISQDESVRLSRRDQRLSKFYTAQFHFLLKELQEGSHVDYEPNEIVPIEYIYRLSPAAALQKWSRVQIPEQPERVYMRRKVSFGESDGEDISAKEQFLADIETSRIVQNQHIAPIWASYATKNSAYFLTPFLGEHTLKSFIDFRTPASFQKIEKADRYLVLLDWFYCLADAVSCLHENDLCHTAIVPSNVLIDGDNHIAFSDIGSLQSFQTDKKFDSIECYNYSAPENYPSPSLDNDDEDQPAPPKTTSSRFRLNRRRRSAESKISSSTSTSGGSSGHQSQHGAYGDRNLGSSSTFSIDSQITYFPVYRSPTSSTNVTSHPSSYHPLSIKRVPSIASQTSNSSSPSENGTITMLPPPVPPKSGKSPPSWFDTSSSLGSSVISLYTDSAATTTNTQATTSPITWAEAEMAADVFSLGCIYLDILTFLLKRKPSDFARHRGARWSRATKSSKLSSPSSSTLGSNSGSSLVSGQVRKLDTSFHANLDKVETWMAKLEHDAFDLDHSAFRAVPPLLEIIRGMLHSVPGSRPPAAVVREKVRGVFVRLGLIGLPRCAERGPASTPGRMEMQEMRVGRNVSGAAASSSTAIADAVEKMPVPFGTIRANGGDGSIPSDRDNAPAPTIPFTTNRGGHPSNVQEGNGSAGYPTVAKASPWIRRGRGYVVR